MPVHDQMSPTRRGQGIGRESVRFTLKALELSMVHQGLLRTWDAHGVFAGLGFTVMGRPEEGMLDPQASRKKAFTVATGIALEQENDP